MAPRSLRLATLFASTLVIGAASFAAPAYAGSSEDVLSQYAPSSLPPVAHAGAPVPTPFTPDYFVGYISDISSYPGGVYYTVIDEFNEVRANHPDIMQANLDRVVEINNNATPERIARAQADARVDSGNLLDNFADAFGTTLAPLVRTAIAENRLPKTRALLDSGYFSRAQGIAASTAVEKAIFNNPRPYVTAPDRIKQYNTADENFYDLNGSASFPSGHANQAALVTTLLATVLPELGPQLAARGSEAGESRVVMGVHYPLDVIGGRMTGMAAAADRWNDPKMRDALTQAGNELRSELEWRTGMPLAEAVAQQERDGGQYLTDAQAADAYAAQGTYGLRTIHDPNAAMVVPQAAPDLLINRFPELSWDQRARVLAATALPAGSPLDDQSADGSWQRINLAAAFAADVSVNAYGGLLVNGKAA